MTTFSLVSQSQYSVQVSKTIHCNRILVSQHELFKFAEKKKNTKINFSLHQQQVYNPQCPYMCPLCAYICDSLITPIYKGPRTKRSTCKTG